MSTLIHSPALALDYASTRSFSQDGHLAVEDNILSAAGVSPYYGSEVPNWQQLGLQPHKIYSVFRPPAELRKAAASLRRKPLMIEHRETLAGNHQADIVVGAVGDNIGFDGEVLRGSLSVWDGDAINSIENGERRKLSCGYFYKPCIEAGTYRGQPYSLVMRDIAFNHVALCEEGRVPGAMVGDSALRTMRETMIDTSVVRRLQHIELAKQAVAPSVGSLNMIFDSPGAVYLKALQILGHDTSDLRQVKHTGAPEMVFRALRGQAAPRKTPAMDAAATARLSEMFPDWNRLGHR